MAEISSLEIALRLTGIDLALQGLGRLVGVFDDAVTSAVDFQSTLTQIQNNTTMTAADMGALSSGVLQLARDAGVGTDILATGFMRAENIVGDTTAAMAILRVATESAVSTGGNAAATTNVLANAMHEYGLDVVRAKDGTLDLAAVQANAARVMGVMHLAAAEGNLTLEQFSDNSGRAIGIAANLGVGLEDVSAAYVSLTKHGFDAAGAQTQVTDLLTHLIKPTKQALDEIGNIKGKTGIDLLPDFSAEGLRTKGLTGVLADVSRAFRAMGLDEAQATEEAMRLINAQRGGLGLASLLGTGAHDYASILADLNDKQRVAGITDESYARTQATVGNQWARLREIAHTTAITVGGELLPYLARWLGALIPLASAVGPRILATLADFREVLGGGLGGGTAGGTLATGFLLLRDSLTNRVIPALQLLWRTVFPPGRIDWTEVLRRGVLGLADGVEHLARWFQLGVDGVVTFRQALAGDWFRNGSPNAFVNLLGRIGLAFRDLKASFDAGGIGAVFGKLWSDYLQPALGNAWNNLRAWVGEQAPQLLTKLGDWGGAFKDWAGGVWSDHLAPGIAKLWDRFTGWVGDHGPQLLTKLGEWGGAFATWAGGIWTNNLAPAIGQLWANLKAGLTGERVQVPMPDVGLTSGVVGQSLGGGTGLVAMFSGWITAFNGWALTTAIPAAERQLGLLVAGAQDWIATTGYPLLKTAAANLWNTLVSPPPSIKIPVNSLTEGMNGVLNGIQPGTIGGGGNFLVTGFTDLLGGLSAWIQGTGGDALGTLNKDLWLVLAAKIAPAIIGAVGIGLKDHWVDIVGILGTLIENTTIPGLALKYFPQIGRDIGNALWGGIKDTPMGAFFRWLNGDTGAGGALPGAGGGGTSGGPGLNAGTGGSGSGSGGEFSPMPGANAPTNIYITMTGPTTAELAASMAGQLYTALEPLLGPGGGSVVLA